jgi:hypothetical protein
MTKRMHYSQQSSYPDDQYIQKSQWLTTEKDLILTHIAWKGKMPLQVFSLLSGDSSAGGFYDFRVKE